MRFWMMGFLWLSLLWQTCPSLHSSPTIKTFLTGSMLTIDVNKCQHALACTFYKQGFPSQLVQKKYFLRTSDTHWAHGLQRRLCLSFSVPRASLGKMVGGWGELPGGSSKWKHSRPGVLVRGNVFSSLWFTAGDRQLPLRKADLLRLRQGLISDLLLAGAGLWVVRLLCLNRCLHSGLRYFYGMLCAYCSHFLVITLFNNLLRSCSPELVDAN